MAFYRALESARPRDQRLFTDLFAVRFLRPSLRILAALARVPYAGRAIARYADQRAPGARTSAIARTRLIDDLLTETVQGGVGQVVILGAGFDCRAFRLPGMSSIEVFEVDHPATLAVKRSRLRLGSPDSPCKTQFVEIDFLRQNLQETLGQAGFDSPRPGIFLWEGVTNYLTSDAVDDVLRYVASCTGGSRLVFTYVDRGVLCGSVEFPDAAGIMSTVAGMGEPWTFGLPPAELSSYLEGRGLQLDLDWGATEYRARYFGHSAGTMTGYDFYHVAMARVPGVNELRKFTAPAAHQND
jgi:methyltransferase (TIGR00027 family)